jgi:hypothetical protein
MKCSYKVKCVRLLSIVHCIPFVSLFVVWLFFRPALRVIEGNKWQTNNKSLLTWSLFVIRTVWMKVRRFE